MTRFSALLLLLLLTGCRTPVPEPTGTPRTSAPIESSTSSSAERAHPGALPLGGGTTRRIKTH